MDGLHGSGRFDVYAQVKPLQVEFADGLRQEYSEETANRVLRHVRRTQVRKLNRVAVML
jgi:hypothetical protein